MRVQNEPSRFVLRSRLGSLRPTPRRTGAAASEQTEGIESAIGKVSWC